MFQSHYHQCPNCGHGWVCFSAKCTGKMKQRDERCEFGNSTGDTQHKVAAQNQGALRQGKKHRGMHTIW